MASRRDLKFPEIIVYDRGVSLAPGRLPGRAVLRKLPQKTVWSFNSETDTDCAQVSLSLRGASELVGKCPHLVTTGSEPQAAHAGQKLRGGLLLPQARRSVSRPLGRPPSRGGAPPASVPLPGRAEQGPFGPHRIPALGAQWPLATAPSGGPSSSWELLKSGDTAPISPNLTSLG